MTFISKFAEMQCKPLEPIAQALALNNKMFVPLLVYNVEVKTGYKSDAETKSKVYITIYGALGTLPKTQLKDRYTYCTL